MTLEDKLKQAMGYHKTLPCCQCAHYTPGRVDHFGPGEAPPQCRLNAITLPVDPDGTCERFTRKRSPRK